MTGARRLLRGLMAFAVTAAVVAPASATTLVRQSLDELVASNAAIVVGEVVDTSSHWNVDGTFIVTDVRVAVQEVVKGNPKDREINFTVMGGTVGDLTTLIVGGAQLAPGNSYVLFLNEEELPGRQRALTVRDHAQGAFDLRIAKDGLRAVSQAVGHPLLPDAQGLVDAAGGEEGYPYKAMVQSLRELVDRSNHQREAQ
jgi:hypothetical protein